LALSVRIKPRAERQIDSAAAWWNENRPAAPGAIREDLKTTLEALVEQPGIGASVENVRNQDVRRLFLSRVRYFVYYRVQGSYLDVVAFWHESREEGPRV
jgi:plasmid stabilization system protein ParE